MIFFLIRWHWRWLAVVLGLLAGILPERAQAQQSAAPSSLTGSVFIGAAPSSPLPGALISWLGAAGGTAADAAGAFTLPYPTTPPPWRLVVRFLGYAPDTIRLTTPATGPLRVGLRRPVELAEARVEGRAVANSASSIGQMQTISTRDLQKSACCNLAESFETNAAVEVSTTDAVSGAKQIQLLGLDGAYSLLTVDNQPALRGLATPYRLNYLAGPWIEAIDIIKGTGSVINGYEAISGQVNIRLKEPDKAERLHVNAYVNDLGKLDLNAVVAGAISQRSSAEVLLHADHLSHRVDRNRDGFLDLPLATQLNALAKWKYKSGTGWVNEVSVGALRETRVAGQTSYRAADDPLLSSSWGLENIVTRWTGATKTSYTFAGRPYQSLGLLTSFVAHDFDGAYGRRTYVARERSAQATLLAQGIIGNTAHVWKAGLSYFFDDVRETVVDLFGADGYARGERVPGVFAEYTYQNSHDLTLVAGARYDHHNLFGAVFTPRVNAKYDVRPNTILRLTGGRGFRVATPIAENAWALSSARQLVFSDQALRPERAWNAGGSLTQYVEWGSRPGALIIDYYWTNFQSQVIADPYATPHALLFANLQGASWARALQVEAQYELLKGLQAKAAYKWYDVRTTYLGGYLLPRPLLPRHRAFANLGYASPFDRWRADFTVQWYGHRPVPGHHEDGYDPSSGRAVTQTAPHFTLFNAQLTRAFKRLEAYVGVENLTNYRQPNVIVDAASPFSPSFDAGMVWGPVFGRLTYAGLRYTLR